MDNTHNKHTDEQHNNEQHQLSFKGALDRFANTSSDPPLLPPSPLPSPRKHSQKHTRKPMKYAPPATYSHIPPVPDILAPDLTCIFIGINPGLRTGIDQHMFAHPSNQFWKLLFRSGLVSRALSPADDRGLPAQFGFGITNLVDRVTRSEVELSREEMVASVPALEQRVRQLNPKFVCVVGKSIWEAVVRFKTGRPLKSSEFTFGWQHPRECGFSFADTTSSRITPTSSQIKTESDDIDTTQFKHESDDTDTNYSSPRILVMPSTSGRVIDRDGTRLAVLRDLAAAIHALDSNDSSQRKA
ncbi:uracil-DNA glycosylase-like protein [Myxozyma melibiosi]|uniref:Uracil-DNA glycosylase-like protein n=1 Tax=Myxozyma melibiosi TaxID=54550 RepID=A0ABR1F4K7_9ASCO